MLHRFTMDRTLSEVSPLAQSVTGLMVGWPDESREAVDLTLVEALSNIVRHGSRTETRQIGIEVDLAQDRITVEVVDFTSPMPPDLLERAGNASFDFDADDIQSIPEGGRGLALILCLMDEVSLHEGPDTSRLRLIRRR